jgi:hypothetical protein
LRRVAGCAKRRRERRRLQKLTSRSHVDYYATAGGRCQTAAEAPTQAARSRSKNLGCPALQQQPPRDHQRHHRWRPGHEQRYGVFMGMSDVPNPHYDQAKRSVQALGPADQLRLIAELVGRLSGELDRQPRRSLLELQGLGKGVWQGVDVDEYLRRERSSWNG